MLPGTDGATEFLPFLNWTACSRHPELWPLQGGRGGRGICDREQPFARPQEQLTLPQLGGANVLKQPLQGPELQPCREVPTGMLGFTGLAQAEGADPSLGWRFWGA